MSGLKTLVPDVLYTATALALVVLHLWPRPKTSKRPHPDPTSPPTLTVSPPANRTGFHYRNRVYPIQPTSQVPNVYSDISLSNFFNSHVLLINSERQTIWQRFTAMVIGNSIVVTLVARGPISPPAGIAICLFGLLMCGGWLILTCSGYNHYNHLCDLARRFVWPGLADYDVENPVESMFRRISTDWIYVVSILIVAFFMAGYIVMLAYWLTKLQT